MIHCLAGGHCTPAHWGVILLGNERDSDVKIFTAEGEEILMQGTIELEIELPKREYPKLIDELEVTFVIKKPKNHYCRYMHWLKCKGK
ncbi:MAG: hypothetical protein IJ797_09740 [Selenomonadaceae bacterium]|nr:hypothetical protein [Selenomonadaceae bacterium]